MDEEGHEYSDNYRERWQEDAIGKSRVDACKGMEFSLSHSRLCLRAPNEVDESRVASSRISLRAK